MKDKMSLREIKVKSFTIPAEPALTLKAKGGSDLCNTSYPLDCFNPNNRSEGICCN